MSIRNYIRNFYRHICPVIYKGENNTIKIESKLKKFTIDISGNNNNVTIDDGCLLTNGSVSIVGDSNQLIIESGVRIYGPLRIDAKDGATVIIRKEARLRGVHIVCESGKVEYGSDSTASYNVVIRNTDSHSIFDLDSNERINSPKDVVIGKHVWLAQNAMILKGVTIGNNSIIGAGAIVTKDCPPNSIMVGNPAKVVKENVYWER